MFKRIPLVWVAGIFTSALVTAVAIAQPAAVPAVSPAPTHVEVVTIPLALQTGDRLAIVGDSITEQRLYSRFMEDYLTACTPELNLWIVQLGWSGEKAGEFLDRMDPDLLSFKPTIFTTCYGMNDGLYRAYDQTIGDMYTANTKLIVARGQAAGARVIVGSPGAVDTQYFKSGGRNAPVTPAVYNDNLDHLKAIALTVARDQHAGFADVHDAMIAAMAQAKEKLGKEYPVCGLRDGLHPGPNGHLVMAYAFLKALGVNGDLGTITIDMFGGTGGGKAQATGGHRVLSFTNGTAEIESTRYPFCFTGTDNTEASTRSIAPFLPFNQDLNRLTLVVTGLKSEKASVTWGANPGATRTFTAAQLAQGINLAAEFADANPFAPAFAAVDAAVAAKQAFETPMIKNYYHALGGLQNGLPDDAEAAAAIKTLKARLAAKQDALRQTVKAAVVPVKHTIKIEPQ